MLAVAASMIATLAIVAPGQPTGADATWDWYWQGAAAPAATASEEGLGTVYLYAEGGFDAKVRKAMAALRAQGTEVEALGGEPVWARPHNRAGLLEFVRAARRQRIEAIHLDIEPYSLRMWRTDRARLMRSYLNALGAARRAAGPIPVNADIPYWHGPGLLHRILRRVDAVTVMDYRDAGSEAVEFAREEVRAAADAGKKATIGLETGDVRPGSVTFFEEGRTALTDAIAEIRTAYEDHRGFGGIAVHDAASLAAL
jgi:hypothetical protein